MTQVHAVNFGANSTYNAVNIRINNPQASIPECSKKGQGKDYNAVNIEVNNPKLKACEKPVYDYPEATEIVTCNQALVPVEPIEIPIVPVAYETSVISFNKSETPDEKNNDLQNNIQENQEPIIIELNDVTAVPVPNITTPEAEKTPNLSLNFHGISFRAAQPEILAGGDLKTPVDVEKVVQNLNSNDLGKVMSQMRDIAITAADKPKEAVPYYNTEVFSGLIGVLNMDISGLEGPTAEQKEIRDKYILNGMLMEQQLKEGKRGDEIELPYKLSEEEVKDALKPTPADIGARTKEAAVYTLAALAKAYGEEFEKQTGNVVPITDMPGISDIVSVLKDSDDPDLKLIALDSLMYIRRPEYNKELKAVFEVMTQDKDPMLAEFASLAIKELDKAS